MKNYKEKKGGGRKGFRNLNQKKKIKKKGKMGKTYKNKRNIIKIV